MPNEVDANAPEETKKPEKFWQSIKVGVGACGKQGCVRIKTSLPVKNFLLGGFISSGCSHVK